MKRYLPVSIGSGQKIENVRFHDSEDYRRFIVAGKELFSINTDWVIATWNGSDIDRYNITVDNTSQAKEKLGSSNHQSITIRLKIETDKNPSEKDNNNIMLDNNRIGSWTFTDNEYSLVLNRKAYINRNDKNKIIYQQTIHVIFDLYKNGEKIEDGELDAIDDFDYREGKLTFIKCKEYQNLIVDLGSEVTQATYGHSSKQLIQNPVNFKKSLKNYYQYESGNHFVQTNETGNFFQTSKIYYKPGIDDNNIGKIDVQSSENDAFARLALDTEEDYKNEGKNIFNNWQQGKKYGKIPNLKLLSLNGDIYNSWSIQINNKRLPLVIDYRVYAISYIYREIIHLAIDSISRDEKLPVLLRLQLLIPNIYPQYRILNILHEINKIFNNHPVPVTTKKQDDKESDAPNPNYPGVIIETYAISEGDAAYRGASLAYKGFDFNKEIKEDEKILIIDAGRGTIDYSIMEGGTGSNELVPVDRGGTVGAGQAVTFILMQWFAYKTVKAPDPQTNKTQNPPEKKKTSDPINSTGMVLIFFKLVKELDKEIETPFMDFFDNLKKHFFSYLNLEKKDKIKYSFFKKILIEFKENNEQLNSTLKSNLKTLLRETESLLNAEELTDYKNNPTYKFVWNSCLKIACFFISSSNLAEKITDIKYIFPMGRAFAFSPLLEAFKLKMDEAHRKKNFFYKWFTQKPKLSNRENSTLQFRKNKYDKINIDNINIDDLKKKSIQLPKPGNFKINGNTNLLFLIKEKETDRVNALLSGKIQYLSKEQEYLKIADTKNYPEGDIKLFYTGEHGEGDSSINAFFGKDDLNNNVRFNWNLAKEEYGFSELFAMTVFPAETIDIHTLNFFDEKWKYWKEI